MAPAGPAWHDAYLLPLPAADWHMPPCSLGYNGCSRQTCEGETASPTHPPLPPAHLNQAGHVPTCAQGPCAGVRRTIANLSNALEALVARLERLNQTCGPHSTLTHPNRASASVGLLSAYLHSPHSPTCSLSQDTLQANTQLSSHPHSNPPTHPPDKTARHNADRPVSQRSQGLRGQARSCTLSGLVR